MEYVQCACVCTHIFGAADGNSCANSVHTYTNTYIYTKNNNHQRIVRYKAYTLYQNTHTNTNLLLMVKLTLNKMVWIAADVYTLGGWLVKITSSSTFFSTHKKKTIQASAFDTRCTRCVWRAKCKSIFLSAQSLCQFLCWCVYVSRVSKLKLWISF